MDVKRSYFIEVGGWIAEVVTLGTASYQIGVMRVGAATMARFTVVAEEEQAVYGQALAILQRHVEEQIAEARQVVDTIEAYSTQQPEPVRDAWERMRRA